MRPPGARLLTGVLAAVRRRRQQRHLEQFAVACLRLDAFLREQPDGPPRYGTLAVAATELLEHGWTGDDLHDLGVAGMRGRPWATGKARDAGAAVPDWVDDADAGASDVERAALRLRARGPADTRTGQPSRAPTGMMWALRKDRAHGTD